MNAVVSTQAQPARDPKRAAWMTDAQWECALVVALAAGGFHHVTGEIKPFGLGVCVSVFAHRLATFDFNDLTTLVLLAHDRAVRVEIAGSSPRRVKLALHRREREGSSFRRHPTIEEAVALHRARFPAPQRPPPAGSDFGVDLPWREVLGFSDGETVTSRVVLQTHDILAKKVPSESPRALALARALQQAKHELCFETDQSQWGG